MKEEQDRIIVYEVGWRAAEAPPAETEPQPESAETEEAVWSPAVYVEEVAS